MCSLIEHIERDIRARQAEEQPTEAETEQTTEND
jgi:hypothetical protein